MMLLSIFDLTLPLSNPVLIFFIILLIIFLSPLILDRIKIPHLLGLIIAGAVVGPHGFNLILRDSGIILSGTVGLLYIMFLAGIEIDISEFKKNSGKSLVFGMYTFTIPLVLGTLSGLYILNFSLPTSILLASMFASHTLIAYPIVSKLGVNKNKAVNVTIGGTMITDTLALLVLAFIVGTQTGDAGPEFWTRIVISVIVFGLLVLFGFPIVGRWFFKRIQDNVSQYIFVLVMVFLGAILAEIAGIESIIGAFLAGLALNRLIPRTSPLMNRIEFVGNAIFIPFFLIGVGMLVDFRVLFLDWETIKVALVMVVVATGAKFIAAWLTQKTFKFSLDERRLIFGLSNAQAAATLAAVLVGYNVIIGENPDGTPIRLLNDSILNGTIVMILVTCTIATFVAQKGAQNIALKEDSGVDNADIENDEKILLPVNSLESIEEAINLGIIIKSKSNKNGMYVLSIVDNTSDGREAESRAKKILDKAVQIAAGSDVHLRKLLRYDVNVENGISNVVREQNITDIIVGIKRDTDIAEHFFGSFTENILSKCNTTTLIYRKAQPIGTIKRHIVIVPENAEHEIGFPFWLIKVWNIARNTGGKIVFYSHEQTKTFIKNIYHKHPIDAEFNSFSDWDDFLVLSRDIKVDDNIIIVLSRKNKPSYQDNMMNVPKYLSKYFKDNSYVLVYPMQAGVLDRENIDLNNPSLLETIEKLDEIGKTITKLFRKIKK